MFKRLHIAFIGIALLVAFTHSIPLDNDDDDASNSDDQLLAEARSLLEDEDMSLDLDDELEAREVDDNDDDDDDIPADRRELDDEDQSEERVAKRASFNLNQYRNDMLKAHNADRKKNCAPALKLDSSLNNRAQIYAQRLANSGKFEHSKNRSNIGENLYMSSGSTPNGKTATASWYNEMKDYNFNHGGFSMATGHFTQVVWKATRKIGVGVATKNGKTYVVANYSPAGNFGNEYQQNVSPAKC